MTSIEIQNIIHQREALIEQIKNAHFYGDSEKKTLIKKEEDELEKLYLLKANQIDVTPENEL